jgi:lipoprotein-anchoring transpeptidase ErfK/SrfK
VYGGLDALVLGSVPEDRRSLSPALRGAHTGIHSWYRTGVFGRHVSNGCIRVPKPGQRALLRDIDPGTAVIVLD